LIFNSFIIHFDFSDNHASIFFISSSFLISQISTLSQSKIVALFHFASTKEPFKLFLVYSFPFTFIVEIFLSRTSSTQTSATIFQLSGKSIVNFVHFSISDLL
jgi:hypothetical protein